MSFLAMGAAVSSLAAQLDTATKSMNAMTEAATASAKSMGSVSVAAKAAKKDTDAARESMDEGKGDVEELMAAFDRLVTKNTAITGYLQKLIGDFKTGLITSREFADQLFKILPNIQALITMLATEGIVLGNSQALFTELAHLAEQIERGRGR